MSPGVLTVSSGQDSLRFPWAVILGTYMDVQIAASPASNPNITFTRIADSKWFGSISDEMTYSGGLWHLRKLLPSGTYEVFALLGRVDTASPFKSGQAWLVLDSVSVNPVASVMMAESEARYLVGTTLKDEQGDIIDSTLPLSWVTRVTSRRTGVGFGPKWVGFPLSSLLVPDRVCSLSSNFVFDYYYSTPHDLPKLYSYAGQVSPVASDVVKDIQPIDLTHRDVEYRTHSGDLNMNPVETMEFSDLQLGISSNYDPTSKGLAAPFHQAWYAQGQPTGNFPWNGSQLNYTVWYGSTGTPPFDPRLSPWRLLTPNQAPGLDGVLRSSLLRTNMPVQQSRTKKVIYGLGPRHYYGRMDNAPTILKLKTNTAVGMYFTDQTSRRDFLPITLNQSMDFEADTLSLFLRDSTGRIIDAGTSLDRVFLDVIGGQYDESLMMRLPVAGRYTLQVWDPSSYVLTCKGAASVFLTVDTRLQDRTPPSMTSFNILGADSEYTDVLLPAEQGRVEFQTSDVEGALSLVSLYYHTDSSRAWQGLPVSLQNGIYCSQLPPFTVRDGLVSLRMVAMDLSGNTLDYRAEPAFHIGLDYTYVNRAPGGAHPLTPGAGNTLQLYNPVKKVKFAWGSAFDYDGWDTLRYTFRIRGGTLGNTYDRSCRDTTLTLDFMGSLALDEIYQWWVETTDGHVVVQSDTSTFRTSSTIQATPGGENELPQDFALAQNYPNPFNPVTTIRYDLPRAVHVSLRVYDVLGRDVLTLVNAEQRAGRYSVTVDGRRLSSGMYIYRLIATPSADTHIGADGCFTIAKKFLLLR